ncbi:MAG: permease [Candidatus Omnitrophota bacterium]|nr:MAG: permease [Candidatus Omnitrophota bacterium]
MIIQFFKETIDLWLDVSPYLLLGMIIAGLLHIFLGKGFISRHLGKGGIASIIKATIFGIPLPVCSCGVIPLATSLKKDGAHSSSVLSFLVSTPTTGVDSIFATYSLLGPLFAIFRPLGSLLAGITVGFLDYMLGGRKKKATFMPSHAHRKISAYSKVRQFLVYSFFEIPHDIGKWLIVGTLIGGAIAAFIPQEIFGQYFFFPLDFLVALFVGIPIYVCATGSIPAVVSLIQKGFSPGAGLVFLIAGPATNAITLSFVRGTLGKRSLYLYLASIIFVAGALGFLFNYVWSLLAQDPSLMVGAGEMLPAWLKVFSGFLMILMIINSFFKRKAPIGSLDYEIRVPDIHCQQCKLTLEGALKELEGIEGVWVDVDKKIVGIKGKPDKDGIIKKIKESGYHPNI